MERKTVIKVLRVFAFTVALVGAMESFFFVWVASDLGSMIFFGLLWMLYFTLLRILVNPKWRTDDGEEEPNLR